MAAVEFEFTTNADAAIALVDDKKLKFSSANTASRNVPAGVEHALTWFVRGAPGARYAIKITSPASAKFEHQASIDASTKDAGLHWFTVSE